MNSRGKLMRSRTNRLLGGVCAGLASYLELDVTLMRLIWVLLTLTAGGAGLVAYLAFWLVVPEEPGPASSRPAAASNSGVTPSAWEETDT